MATIPDNSDVELGLLKLMFGGYSTVDDSDQGRLAEALESKGLIKPVAFGADYTAWKLSGSGLAHLKTAGFDFGA